MRVTQGIGKESITVPHVVDTVRSTSMILMMAALLTLEGIGGAVGLVMTAVSLALRALTNSTVVKGVLLPIGLPRGVRR